MYHPHLAQRPLRLQTSPSARHQQHLSQQRRSVLYISEQPATSIPMPAEDSGHVHHSNTSDGGSGPETADALLESPRHKPLVFKHKVAVASGVPPLVLRIGLAILVFWLVILTLFMLSHILHDTNGSGERPASRTTSSSSSSLDNVMIRFTFPSNGSVSVTGVPAAAQHYQTCCWDRAHRYLYCDGLFATVWDQANQSLVFHPIAGSPILFSDLQGAQCTLICR